MDSCTSSACSKANRVQSEIAWEELILVASPEPLLQAEALTGATSRILKLSEAPGEIATARIRLVNSRKRPRSPSVTDSEALPARLSNWTHGQVRDFLLAFGSEQVKKASEVLFEDLCDGRRLAEQPSIAEYLVTYEGVNLRRPAAERIAKDLEPYIRNNEPATPVAVLATEVREGGGTEDALTNLDSTAATTSFSSSPFKRPCVDVAQSSDMTKGMNACTHACTFALPVHLPA